MFGAFARADCLLTRPMLAVPFPCFVQLHKVVGFSSIKHDLLPFAVAGHGEPMGRTRAFIRQLSPILSVPFPSIAMQLRVFIAAAKENQPSSDIIESESWSQSWVGADV